MPLRYPDIVDEAFDKLHHRPPEAPRAIAVAYSKTRPEFTMDTLAGNVHSDVALS